MFAFKSSLVAAALLVVAQAHGGELRIRNTRPGLEVAMVWWPESQQVT